MASADAAVSAHEYQKALDLYDSILDRKGEGGVSEAARFKAALESCKCLIALGKSQDGVDRYASMFGQYKELDQPESFKHTLAILGALNEANAKPMVSISLIEETQKKYPDQHEKFAALVKKLEARGLSNEEVDKLKKLGYL